MVVSVSDNFGIIKKGIENLEFRVCHRACDFTCDVLFYDLHFKNALLPPRANDCMKLLVETYNFSLNNFKYISAVCLSLIRIVRN